MKIGIVGAGYVGLVSAACFAKLGHDVVCVDKDASKISALKAAIMPIYEPGLAELVAHGVVHGRLTFSTDMADAAHDARIVMLAVGTPSRRGNGHADLRYVYAAAKEAALHLADGALVVTKSTVPPGTGAEIEAIIARQQPSLSFDVASNPEFLREGEAIEDFMSPDRVVIGTESERATALLQELYQSFIVRGIPVVQMGRLSAELTKYAANAFLAAKIGFINEIADLCDAIGGDVTHIAHGIGLDNRIGASFLRAGPGYGGSCFPKDTLALLQTATKARVPMQIVAATAKANDERKHALVGRIRKALGGQVRGKTIAILGLAFKPNTDDIRESPSLALIAGLEKDGAHVVACDPEAADMVKRVCPQIDVLENPYEAAYNADALVLATEWPEYSGLDFTLIHRIMQTPVLVDLRNMLDPASMASIGFTYTSIGRPRTNTSHGEMVDIRDGNTLKLARA